MLSKVKTQGKGKLSPVGAGARGGGGRGACAPSRECIHTSEREISSYSGKDSIGSRVESIAVFSVRT